jgi:phosphoribosylamine--glycine ligase
MGTNVLITGNGAREHALAWKLRQSPKVNDIFLSEPNPGMRGIGQCLFARTPEGICAAVKANGIGLVVIGPEKHLAQGVTDMLREKTDALVFGPHSLVALETENSKKRCKKLMVDARIPTAPFVVVEKGKYLQFEDTLHTDPLRKGEARIPAPYVVKIDGNGRGGNGVKICQTIEEVNERIDIFREMFPDAAQEIIVELFLQGEEIGYIIFSDGTGLYLPSPPSHDYKDIRKDCFDKTGGMGSVVPITPIVAKALPGFVNQIFTPFFTEIGRRFPDKGFVGCAYPNLKLQSPGAAVMEWNGRFPDPETQVYVRLMESDLFEILDACAKGNLKGVWGPKWHDGYVVNVVLASGGYPYKNLETPKLITGIEEAEKLPGIVIFHAGTVLIDGKLYAKGGRILSVTATGKTLEEAIAKAYEAVRLIHFEGMQYRNDIGADLLGRI